MQKNLKMCISYSNTPLNKLNESVESGIKRYKFSGIFTACSSGKHVIINRNGRVYRDTEVLRHLSYLRESIKTNGSILGELDHPEGRFDIQLKEASHKITDLWYDQPTHCVMGTLELLDTPNGKIAQELIDAGYPLFVSSRAAGDVDEKTHEVSIQQIFTYDIVCTPGFAEARLDRVNESLLSDMAKSFLNESVTLRKNKKQNNNLIMSENNIDVYEVNEQVEINEKVSKMINKPINLQELCTPILEKEDSNDTFELPSADTNPSTVDSSDDAEVIDQSPKDTKKIDAKKDDLHEEELDEDKAEKRALILSITAEDKDGNLVNIADAKGDTEKEENRKKILDITSEEEKDSSDAEAEELGDNAAVAEATLKKNKIADEAEKGIAELEQVLSSVVKAESVKESIIARYPFAISLSDENFAKFAALRPNQKKKCSDFIVEHEIYNINAINELWAVPLKEEKRVQQNWLKLASQQDIDLYVNAPLEVQDAIEESAKYVILETQEDVDEFWRRTGLRQAEAKRRMNEEFVSYYKNNVSEAENNENNNPLGYTMDFIKMTEDYFNI